MKIFYYGYVGVTLIMNKNEKRKLKEELGRIFGRYVDDIRENYKTPLNEIYELIANNMDISADTVRKYRGINGVAEKQVKNLLNACIRFEVENHLKRVKLSKFAEQYKETAGKLFGEPLNTEDPELPYIADYFHIMKAEDEKEWNSVVCPLELEKCLNNFFEGEKHLIIVQGTRKSGLTVSVTKYIIDKQKNPPIIVPYIFDIEDRKDEELDEWEEFQEALKGEYVIIRIGYRKFEYYDFLKNAQAQIIILAHTNVGIDNAAGAETVVFNDLVNHMQCTQKMVEMYIPQLYENLRNDKEELNYVIEKIHNITGGLPFAIKKIGKLVWELYHVNGIGIHEIFTKDLWETETGRMQYEDLWVELVEGAWSLIDETEQDVVKKVVCVAQGVSKKMMWFLVNIDPETGILDDILNSLLFMEDGRFRNSYVSYPGVRLFPLMRNLILYKMKSEEKAKWNKFYKNTMNRAVQYLKNEINASEMQNIYKGRMCFLDREGETQVVESVLDFCYRNAKIRAYISITTELEKYFSLRGKIDGTVKNIYDKRLKISKKQKNKHEILMSYSYIIDRCIWRGEKREVEENIKVSDQYMEQYKIEDSTYTSVYFLIKAKYYIYIRYDYKEALNILGKIYESDLAREKRAELEFYRFVCEQRLNESDTKTLFQEECRYLEKENYTNIVLRIQYGLFIVERYIKQCILDNQRKKKLETIEVMLEEIDKDIQFCKYPVSLQICNYYIEKACVSALYGRKWDEFLKIAFKAYNRTDGGIWKKRMKKYLEDIEEKVILENCHF